MESAMAVVNKSLYVNNGSFMNYGAPLVILGYLLSLWFIARGQLVTENNHVWISELIGALWVLGPPLWFYFEQVHYFPHHGHPEADFGQLKARQDALGRLWLAAIIVLAALFTGILPR
jgi:hypothetical protein